MLSDGLSAFAPGSRDSARCYDSLILSPILKVGVPVTMAYVKVPPPRTVFSLRTRVEALELFSSYRSSNRKALFVSLSGAQYRRI